MSREQHQADEAERQVEMAWQKIGALDLKRDSREEEIMRQLTAGGLTQSAESALDWELAESQQQRYSDVLSAVSRDFGAPHSAAEYEALMAAEADEQQYDAEAEAIRVRAAGQHVGRLRAKHHALLRQENQLKQLVKKDPDNAEFHRMLSLVRRTLPVVDHAARNAEATELERRLGDTHSRLSLQETQQLQACVEKLRQKGGGWSPVRKPPALSTRQLNLMATTQFSALGGVGDNGSTTAERSLVAGSGSKTAAPAAAGKLGNQQQRQQEPKRAEWYQPRRDKRPTPSPERHRRHLGRPRVTTPEPQQWDTTHEQLQVAWKERHAQRPAQPHRPRHGTKYMVQDGTGQGSHHHLALAVAAGGMTAAIGGLLATRQHADGRCALPTYPKLSPPKNEPATQCHQGTDTDAPAAGRRGATQAGAETSAANDSRQSVGNRRRRTMTLMQVDGSRVSVPSPTRSSSLSTSSPTRQQQQQMQQQNSGSPTGRAELLAPLHDEKPARRRRVVGGAGFQASAQKYAEVSVVPEAALPRPWHGVRALPRHTGVLSIKRGFHGAF